MKIEKVESTTERTVLTGMILDRSILGRIASKWDGKLFRNHWSNLIAKWCIDYLNRYDKAPGASIETIYNNWAETAQDKKTVELIGRFLETLSEEYESLQKEVNAEYLIDIAGKHFNQVKLERLTQEVEDSISEGKLEDAEKRISNWGRVELGTGTGIDVLNDMEAIRTAFETKAEPLITFPGAMGEFFGDSLERDGFIGIMGPDKRGKSFWLIELAFRALLQKRRVAFFEVGDMSQHQILRRMMLRVSRHPYQAGTIDYPIKIERNRGDATATVEFEDREFKEPLSWRRAWKASQKVRKRTRSKTPMWRLSVHPNSTITVSGIRSILSDWEREGWVPDVVVIDYADILAPENSRAESRDQINETWKRLRAMSQSLHCLVVTASQSNADAYKQSLLTRTNFSEDKRKLAHVTGMVGLNQTPEEKDLGIIRLNWIVRREGVFSETRCIHVAGCLAVANPAIISVW